MHKSCFFLPFLFTCSLFASANAQADLSASTVHYQNQNTNLKIMSGSFDSEMEVEAALASLTAEIKKAYDASEDMQLELAWHKDTEEVALHRHAIARSPSAKKSSAKEFIRNLRTQLSKAGVVVQKNRELIKPANIKNWIKNNKKRLYWSLGHISVSGIAVIGFMATDIAPVYWLPAFASMFYVYFPIAVANQPIVYFRDHPRCRLWNIGRKPTSFIKAPAWLDFSHGAISWGLMHTYFQAKYSIAFRILAGFFTENSIIRSPSVNTILTEMLLKTMAVSLIQFGLWDANVERNMRELEQHPNANKEKIKNLRYGIEGTGSALALSSITLYNYSQNGIYPYTTEATVLAGILTAGGITYKQILDFKKVMNWANEVSRNSCSIALNKDSILTTTQEMMNNAFQAMK